MAKKLPDYVHCSKCGYRGIDQNHDCTKVRAATAAVIEQAKRRALEAATEPQLPPMADLEAPLPDATRMLKLALEHGRLFGRHITYVIVGQAEVDNDGKRTALVEIRQRCSPCCGDIDKRITVKLDEPFFGLDLGAAARKVYLQHRCPPVSDSLLGFTYEELEVLHAELERDGMAMIERAAAVDQLRKARPR